MNRVGEEKNKFKLLVLEKNNVEGDCICKECKEYKMKEYIENRLPKGEMIIEAITEKKILKKVPPPVAPYLLRSIQMFEVL